VQPVRNLKMMASRAARWSIRRRPVLLGGSHSARIGSIFSHNWSGTRQMVGRGFSWGIVLANWGLLSSGIVQMIAGHESFEIVS
jgi:hypothetical protein